MKIIDVPQDDDKTIDKTYIPIVYAKDENGKYVKVPSIGWEPENIALRQVWDNINKTIQETKHKVLSGELSNIAYFMVKNQMDIKKLSFFTGIPKRKIRKHLIPINFKKIDRDILILYCKVFNISEDELMNFKNKYNSD